MNSSIRKLLKIITESIVAQLQAHYNDNYAMIAYLSDVAVLRSEKF